MALGGNGEGERSAAEHGGIVEIAALGIVDDVDEDAAAARKDGDAVVQFGRRRGDHSEKHAAQIAGREPALSPRDPAGEGPGADVSGGTRSYDAHAGPGA